MFDKIGELVTYLLNTSMSLEQGLRDLGYEEEMTEDELTELNTYIFQCAECGYWCEVCEANTNYYGDLICVDCLNMDVYQD